MDVMPITKLSQIAGMLAIVTLCGAEATPRTCQPRHLKTIGTP
jgi:hypothetical protein